MGEIIRVGFDVMTGDQAETGGGIIYNIEAAEEARDQLLSGVLEDTTAQLYYIGDQEKIHDALCQIYGGDRFPEPKILHASDTITMDTDIRLAMRMRQSSMAVLAQAVKTQKIDGALSIGNTGAWSGLAQFYLGHKSKEFKIRPGIGVEWPRANAIEGSGKSLLMEAGFDAKNIDPDAIRYLEFFLLASTYLEANEENQCPSFGILSFGTEDEKASENAKKAKTMFNELLAQGLIQGEFHGFIEPSALFDSKNPVDIILTDGKTGNIVLKTAEATARLMKNELKQGLSPWDRFCMILGPRGAIKKRLAPYSTEANPVMPLMGLSQGVVTIGHGSSSQKTIESGLIRTAQLTANHSTEEMNRLMYERYTAIQGSGVLADFS